MPDSQPTGHVSPRLLVALLALTSGITVANLYYAQPLLHSIATEFEVTEAGAGVAITAVQLGYAAGLFFVVPLGDILPRRALMLGLLGVNAVALALTAFAPSITVIALVAPIVGLASVVAQIVVPFATTVVPPERRASAIGTVMGALLLGILLSRTLSGIVGDLAGWRAMFGLAAVLMLVLGGLLAWLLPAAPREVGISYAAQMRSTVALAFTEPVLRWRSLLGAGLFASFSVFWTTVTFHLSAEPFGYSSATIGLFGLVGAAGASFAMLGGRLLDRYRHHRWLISGIALGLLFASWVALVLGSEQALWLIVGALGLDAGVQSAHVTNQTVIYDLTEGARSRLTAIYMTSYFLGGALGTSIGTLAYERSGWTGACLAGLACAAVALVAWLRTRHWERQPV